MTDVGEMIVIEVDETTTENRKIVETEEMVEMEEMDEAQIVIAEAIEVTVIEHVITVSVTFVL